MAKAKVVGNRTQATSIGGAIVALLAMFGLINTAEIPAAVMEHLDLLVSSLIGLFLALKIKNGSNGGGD